ncbi:aldo/keto reductase [Streptomyces sp. NPDC017260]
MRLTGPGAWGDRADRDTALSVLRQAVHTHGISHIDTADSYGPHTVEHLIREGPLPLPRTGADRHEGRHGPHRHRPVVPVRRPSSRRAGASPRDGRC